MAHDKRMHQDPVIPQANVQAEHGIARLHTTAADLHAAKSATVDERRTRQQPVRDTLLDRVRSFRQDSKQYVRENPRKTVLAVLGAGFVLGLTFRR